MKTEYEKSKSGWRFILYDGEGLDFCKSIWFPTKEICEQYAKLLEANKC